MAKLKRPEENEAPPPPPGIVCPRCGCSHMLGHTNQPWEVTKTERKHGFVRRRRVCRNCGRVVYTRESIEVR